MTNQIQQELPRIETQHDIKILYAVESGSRAWEVLRWTAIGMGNIFMCTGPSGICRSTIKRKEIIKIYLLKDMLRVKKYFYVLCPILACDWIRDWHDGACRIYEIARQSSDRCPLAKRNRQFANQKIIRRRTPVFPYYMIYWPSEFPFSKSMSKVSRHRHCLTRCRWTHSSVKRWQRSGILTAKALSHRLIIVNRSDIRLQFLCF